MSATLPSSVEAPATARAAGTVPARSAGSGAPSDRVIGAIERLALSRERLRVAMLPPPPRESDGLTGRIGSFVTSLVDRLREIPAATVVIEGVQDWWAQHPLRIAGVVAAEATRRIAAPIAERRPLALVFGAVLVGALLALARPWRLLLRPAVLVGLLPMIAARAMRELPIEHWLQVAVDFAAPRQAAPRRAAPRPEASVRTEGTSDLSSTEAGRVSASRLAPTSAADEAAMHSMNIPPRPPNAAAQPEASAVYP